MMVEKRVEEGDDGLRRGDLRGRKVDDVGRA